MTTGNSDATHAVPTEAGSTEAPPRHVLIVEDDEELAELLRVWVKDYWGSGTTVDVEHTAAGARQRLESGSVLDVALLDRRLPDGDACDLLEGIACQFDAITVVITGVSPGSDLIRLPVTDYLVKPIDDETLVTRLSLLEKLAADDALASYTDARKASLLEYHLDDPEEAPLFRRFAARWSYDRLEIAHLGSQSVVYELYTDDATDERDGGDDVAIHVSIAGTLAADVDDLLARGEIDPVGELLSTDDEYAWIRTDGADRIERDPDSIAIYGFSCETPEQYVTDEAGELDDDAPSYVELAEILECGFN